MSPQTESTFSPRCFFVVLPTIPKHTAKRTENPKATQSDGTIPAGTFGSPTLRAMMVQSKLMAAPKAAAAHVDAKSVSASPSSPVRRLSRIQSPCPIIKCSPCGTLNVVEVSSCRSSSSGDMAYGPSLLSDSACSIAGSCSACSAFSSADGSIKPATTKLNKCIYPQFVQMAAANPTPWPKLTLPSSMLGEKSGPPTVHWFALQIGQGVVSSPHFDAIHCWMAVGSGSGCESAMGGRLVVT